VIGSIPGPMIFGAVLDKGCVLWKPGVCGEDGANCLIYENVTMSISIMTFFFVFKVLGILSYGVALLFSARSKILDEEDEPEKDPSD
ncbi:Solute carrier organic anion transporter family member, partial [Caligus rogercresseyi]